MQRLAGHLLSKKMCFEFSSAIVRCDDKKCCCDGLNEKVLIFALQINNRNMDDNICTNYASCRLVQAADFDLKADERNEYLRNYCRAGKDVWLTCTRYITKSQLNFCPDFVLPDTDATPDEIIARFDADETLL